MDIALSLQIEGVWFDSFRVRLFSFFVVVLFCFVPLEKKKHIGSVLQHQFIRK